MQDPVRMNHPDLPGVENAVVEREAYRGTWYAKGWRSDDDALFTGPEDAPVPRTVGSHEDRYHHHFVNRPAAWGVNRWNDARHEADTRQVKVHGIGDSIFQGVGAVTNRYQGQFELVMNALKAEYGDGGTGWLPVHLAAESYRVVITGAPTGGTFQLRVSVNGGANQDTATIAWNASSAAVATAIENLSNVPTGEVFAIGGALPANAVAFTFGGSLHAATIQITVLNPALTGGTAPTVTVARAWTAGTGMGGVQGTVSGTAMLRFENMIGTEIRGFHRNTGIVGSFRYRIDGGSWTTHGPTPVAFGQDPGDFVVGSLSNTAHLVEIEWVSGTVSFFGLMASRATGIVPYRFAQSGQAASTFMYGRHRKIPGGTSPNRGFNGTNGAATVTVPAPGVFTSDMQGQFITGPAGIATNATIATVDSATQVTMSAVHTATFSNAEGVISDKGVAGIGGINMLADPFLAAAIGRPDLVIIQLGANDPAGAFNDAVTYRDGMSKIMRRYTEGGEVSYTPDIVIGLEHIGTWFDIESEYSGIASVAADLANGSGAILVDHWGRGQRSWKYWNDLGYFADAIHPSTTGHAEQAQVFIDQLLAPA